MTNVSRYIEHKIDFGQRPGFGKKVGLRKRLGFGQPYFQIGDLLIHP